MEIIENWDYDIHLGIMFNFNSFESFEKLINLKDEPFAQMWALWALYNNFQINCEFLYKNLRKSTKI